MGKIDKKPTQIELEQALDEYANEKGDIELVNLLNYWLIKKLNKRMELKCIQ